MDDLIQKAKEHIKSYGYNGFAEHTVMPSLMAEFAKIYHESEVKNLGLFSVNNSFCDLYKKNCMGGLCSVTPFHEKCKYLKQNLIE